MDFLDPQKKRAHHRRLIIGYILIGLVLVAVTVILVFVAYGFRYDRKTDRIIQNGLVFIDSQPSSANYYLNGQLKGQTGDRFNLAEGHYVVSMKRPGYQTWQHTIDLRGGSIERLTYSVLFPKTIAPTNVKSYARAPGFASQSPDNRWLLVQRPQKMTGFDLYDLAADHPKAQTYSLPNNLVNRAAGQHLWRAIEWTANSQRLLASHTVGNRTEYLLLDRRNPVGSLNLTKLLPHTALSAVRLRNHDINQIYFINARNHDLYRFDLGSKALQKMANNVTQYRPYGTNTLVYLPVVPAHKPVLVNIVDNSKLFHLRLLPADDTYELATQDFKGKMVVVASSVNQRKAYVYYNPQVNLRNSATAITVPAAVLDLSRRPNSLSVSPSGRFTAFQAGSEIAVYDLEDDHSYHFTLKLDAANHQPLTWMDGFRFSLAGKNSVAIEDFSGENGYRAKSTVGTASWFNPKHKALYYLGAKAKSAQTSLVQASLLTPADQ